MVERYATYAASPTPNLAYHSSGKVPLAAGQENIDMTRSRTKGETPSVVGVTKHSSAYVSPSKSDIGAKVEQRFGLSSNGDVKSSPIKPSEYSPVKGSPSKVKFNSNILRS
jgi:hypothetical protein